jgi:predicted phosphodiesterase
MIVNWLVFSDLHLQYKNFKTQILREKLINFISGQPVEFILIAGDCFYKYQKGMEIESTIDYIHTLCSASGCGKSNIYITPGNHDLARTEARLNILQYYTGIDYATGEKKGECRNLTEEAYKLLFNEEFSEGFCEMHKNIVGKQYNSTQLIEKENYRILNVNTCMLSGGYYSGNDEKKRNLHLDEGNLSVEDDKLLNELGKIVNDEKINIVLMHHGIEYLRENERNHFQKLMEDHYIDIVFAGHSHKIGIDTYDNTGNGMEQFTCGAPIMDDYSEPSFIKCTFDTDSKDVTCSLFAFSNDSWNWYLCNNSKVRKFSNGKYVFAPKRFGDRKDMVYEIPAKNEQTYGTIRTDHFNEFGIVDALPLREFISLRNKLILEAEGDIVLAGQSLENAFDIRKDSDSIVESLKNNKRIRNVDIFLTDPIMFDTSEIYEGDTPISRIDKTVHTILHDIAYSLTKEQTINIYFIPLVQLDHMVFANDMLLLRNTLLWTNDDKYKATHLVCKNINKAGINESIVNSSMYRVYKEYINKLKKQSIVIKIQENGYDRTKETLAKIKHRQWRERLYNLRESGRLKGQINMHKLYRTQLISDLHSSWNSRYRTFSSEINWASESESSFFTAGQKTAINMQEDLYNPQKLLNDATQRILLPYVKETEHLLNELVKTYDSEAFAKIYPSLDIGIPNNRLRLAGGFATGMLVVLKCGTPIVPVDTTVNVCSSSYYQFDSVALRDIPIKQFFNESKINKIINEGSKEEGLAFSFNTGNHFLLLCKSRVNNTYYLVLHSSAKQFKDTYMGLYPNPHNWYYGYIKTYCASNSNRYIRYIKDNQAIEFISTAKKLNKQNEDIHNWFAGRFSKGIHYINSKTYHHYGMPTDYSIAIGTYVIDNDDIVPIFSREDYPIWLFRPDEKMWSIELEGKRKYIVPHGWGQCIRPEYFGVSMNEMELSSCKLEIGENNNLILKDSQGKRLKEFEVNYEKRFTEEEVEVRRLWNADDYNANMLKYSGYLSGKMEDVLDPVALFSKNNDGVKYYDIQE